MSSARFLALTVAALICIAPAASRDGGIAKGDVGARAWFATPFAMTRARFCRSRAQPPIFPGLSPSKQCRPVLRRRLHGGSDDLLPGIGQTSPSRNEQDFHLGKALFEKLWVSSPSSTQASDGLGPLYNARACESCHVRDGRGRPPEGAADATSMLLRLARAPRDDAERRADRLPCTAQLSRPGLWCSASGQPCRGLLPRAVSTSPIRKNWWRLPAAIRSRSASPHYAIADPGYGPLDAATTLSPRVASPMIGIVSSRPSHEADILGACRSGGSRRRTASADVRPRARAGPARHSRPLRLESRTLPCASRSPCLCRRYRHLHLDLDRSHGDCTELPRRAARSSGRLQPRLGASRPPTRCSTS